MPGEAKKLVKEFKTLEKEIKGISAAQGKKLKKDITSWLDQVWKLEDKISEAIEDARKGGHDGKKADDFKDESAYKKALEDWTKAVKKHHENIDEFTEYTKRADTLHAKLKKQCTKVEKELKSGKSDGDAAKTETTMKAVKAALPELQKTGKQASGLPVHVVFYARKIKASVDKIVADAVKKSSPPEFPKSMQEDQRKKTERKISSAERKITHYCKTAKANLGKDLKNAEKSLSMAKSELTALERLNDEIAAASKKMRKQIKDLKDPKERQALNNLIKVVSNTYKRCEKGFDEIDELVEEAQAQRV